MIFGKIDVTFDGISENSTAGAVGYGFMVRQDGIVYLTGLGQILNGVGWENRSATSLFATSLRGQVGNMGDPNLNPDFSSSGGPIEFGFSASNGTFGESTNNGGVDNWRVTLHLVPEPSPAMLTMVILLAGVALRRRPNVA